MPATYADSQRRATPRSVEKALPSSTSRAAPYRRLGILTEAVGIGELVSAGHPFPCSGSSPGTPLLAAARTDPPDPVPPAAPPCAAAAPAPGPAAGQATRPAGAGAPWAAAKRGVAGAGGRGSVVLWLDGVGCPAAVGTPASVTSGRWCWLCCRSPVRGCCRGVFRRSGRGGSGGWSCLRRGHSRPRLPGVQNGLVEMDRAGQPRSLMRCWRAAAQVLASPAM